MTDGRTDGQTEWLLVIARSNMVRRALILRNDPKCVECNAKLHYTHIPREVLIKLQLVHVLVYFRRRPVKSNGRARLLLTSVHFN